MTLSPHTRLEITIALIVGTALGCIFGSIAIIGMTLQPFVVTALAKAPTSTPTNTTTRTPTASPSATPYPTRTPRSVVQHFLMARPVAPSATRTIPDPVYLYGTTRGGDLDVHHGEDFDENPSGTPLYAVADGTIVTAGSDAQPVCGDDYKTVCGANLSPDTNGFYGNLVVIRLWQDYKGQPVFALYGHMDSVGVDVGDDVKQGDPIGNIGMTGVALGPHVHFETRLGVNDYAHTRNPILWMAPLPGRGSLAGRYTDAKGNLVRGATVNVYRADDTFLVSTETYSRDKWAPVNSDDDLGENFSMGDLPAGDYTIRIAGYAQRVTIQDGKLSFVEIGGLQ